MIALTLFNLYLRFIVTFFLLICSVVYLKQFLRTSKTTYIWLFFSGTFLIIGIAHGIVGLGEIIGTDLRIATTILWFAGAAFTIYGLMLYDRERSLSKR
mgnify:CR=1 FL=1